MGIKGLPEVLRPYLTPVQVSKHRGKRAAVDAYSWLHKGAYSCALELGTGNLWWRRKKWDAPYVRYCIHRAQMLRHFGVTPVIVFDGDRLPAKGGEEKERRDRRAECMRKGHEKHASGDRDGATFMFAQGLDVTPAMAHELIAALKREGFEFVVAPYEADAQIAALAQLGGGEKGGVDVVFTEDSDLVAYGCPTVLFKLDKHGEARELNLADVLNPGPERAVPGESSPSETEAEEELATTARAKEKGKPRRAASAPLNFSGWDHERFLGLCVLSGCDFLPNVRGVGIKKAHALMLKHGTVAAALAALRADAKVTVPEGYDDAFRRAFWTFRHARVYDPDARRTRPLNPMPPELEAMEAADASNTAFLGAAVEDAVAVEIAEGRLDPIARVPFVVPASPQKQRPWAPRTGAAGNARGVQQKPKAKPAAFKNLFAAPTRKKVATPAKTPNFFEDGDYLDDDAVAEMMERMEKGGEERSRAAMEAATTTSAARTDEKPPPTPGNWIPPAIVGAASDAGAPGSGEEGATETRETTTRVAALPKNIFARAAPARAAAAGAGALAGLFAKEAKRSEAVRRTSAEHPEAARGGSAGGVLAARGEAGTTKSPRGKKGTMLNYFGGVAATKRPGGDDASANADVKRRAVL